jgi:hypothetical protein
MLYVSTSFIDTGVPLRIDAAHVVNPAVDCIDTARHSHIMSHEAGLRSKRGLQILQSKRSLTTTQAIR